MTAHSVRTIAVVTITLMVAGCANDGSTSIFTGSGGGLSTSSVDTAAGSASKSNPLCLTLASQIDALNKEGIPDKVSKAAIKKYKLKGSDIAKADELNKANSEFQSKCSDYPPAPTVAAVIPPEKPAAKVAKAKPPIPSPKSAPVGSASLAPENTAPPASPSGAVAETAAAPTAAQP